MRTFWIVTLLSCFLVAVAHAQTPPLTDAQRAEAGARWESGKRKFDVGKYEEAAREFETAYEISGHPDYLFNVAQALRLDGKLERALLFYRNYLRRKENPNNRAEVENHIAELEAKIQEQHEHAPPEPTKPTTPLPEPQPKPEAPPPATLPPVAAHAEPAPPPRWLLPASGVAIGIGVAGVGVGVAMSLLARAASNDVQSAAASHEVFDGNLQNRQNAGKTYATAAIATYVAGGVLTAAGVIGLGVALHGKSSSQRAWIAPTLGAGSAGLAVVGHY